MNINLQLQKQVKMLASIVGVIAVIPPVLGSFGVIEGITVLIWSVFLLGFIAVILLLGTFWIHKFTRQHLYIFTAGYWLSILIAVVIIGGLDTHQTLHLSHPADANIQSDLNELFRKTLAAEESLQEPGSLIRFEKSDQGTDIYFLSKFDIADYRIDEFLKLLVRQKITDEANVSLLILEGDDPRMYKYSGLKPGDNIEVSINWLDREMQRSESAALMLGARDCNIRLPLVIKNKKIEVDIKRDPELAREKLGVALKELSEEELQIAQDLFMVAHQFNFSQSQGSELFENLQYDGAGALIFISSMFSKSGHLANDCDNKNNAMLELALLANDPYFTRLLFPQLQMHLLDWELEQNTHFIGVYQMFQEFPWKLQNLFSF